MNLMKNAKGLNEEEMTESKTFPLWIRRVIGDGFIARTLRGFVMGYSRFWL